MKQLSASLITDHEEQTKFLARIYAFILGDEFTEENSQTSTPAIICKDTENCTPHLQEKHQP